MKPSELKVGDHFRRTDRSNLGVWRLLDTKSPDFKAQNYIHSPRVGVCVTAEPNSLRVGTQSDWDSDTCSVELVPMPAPYVVGKAYRTRDAGKFVYAGEEPNSHYPEHTHVFFGGNYGRTTVRPNGHETPYRDRPTSPAVADIMGEWIDTDTKKETPTMSKRTLPSVTLDAIFLTLRDKDACWFRELGPMKLAKKLEALQANASGMDGDKITLRTVHNAIRDGAIGRGDGAWLVGHTRALVPDSMMGTLGTPAFEKTLDEWENPKPKVITVGDIEPGKSYVWDRTTYTVPRAPIATVTVSCLEEATSRVVWDHNNSRLTRMRRITEVEPVK